MTESEWHTQIDRAVDEPDPILGNLLITVAHDDLSRALLAALGPDAGANFHSWAVWGSKKAGETIRFEDTRGVRHGTWLVSGLTAVATGALTIGFGGLEFAPIAALLTILVAATPPLLLHWRLTRSRAALLHGNRIVLDDIGRVTARYVTSFPPGPVPGSHAFDRFLSSVPPGHANTGGQALLRRAFSAYHAARLNPDLDQKHEATLLANCCAILHEHLRLQPHIRRSMPLALRRSLTMRSLRFRLGSSVLSVGADVTTLSGQAFPDTLRQLDNPELVAFLTGQDGWDRTPDSLNDSAAGDWSVLHDRMNFIVDLFRSRHLSPDVVAPPFTGDQTRAIRSGRVPFGAL